MTIFPLFVYRNFKRTRSSCKEKLKVGLKSLRGTLWPDMRDLDERKLFSYNLNKTWFCMILASLFRLRAIIGTRKWQIDLKEADRLADEGTEKFSVESYQKYRDMV